jgi:hypothetical protein
VKWRIWQTGPDIAERQPLQSFCCALCYERHGLNLIHGMAGCQERECCETTKATGHLGKCPNSYMNTGEWRR